jgi:hypothetical protein
MNKTSRQGALRAADGAVLKTGTAQNKVVELYGQNGMHRIYAPVWDHHSLEVNFPDFVLLERYFGMIYAPIEWNVQALPPAGAIDVRSVCPTPSPH